MKRNHLYNLAKIIKAHGKYLSVGEIEVMANDYIDALPSEPCHICGANKARTKPFVNPSVRDLVEMYEYLQTVIPIVATRPLWLCEHHYKMFEDHAKDSFNSREFFSALDSANREEIKQWYDAFAIYTRTNKTLLLVCLIARIKIFFAEMLDGRPW